MNASRHIGCTSRAITTRDSRGIIISQQIAGLDLSRRRIELAVRVAKSESLQESLGTHVSWMMPGLQQKDGPVLDSVPLMIGDFPRQSLAYLRWGEWAASQLRHFRITP
jgi:hypothetical protein